MSCANCRTVIELMKTEIKELTEQEAQLKRINNNLIQVINQGQNNIGSFEEVAIWKQKYQEQVRINNDLQKQLTYHQQVKGLYESVDGRQSMRASVWKENRGESVKKMDKLMDTYLHKRSKQNRIRSSSGFCDTKGQIVLRIVDQRTHRLH